MCLSVMELERQREKRENVADIQQHSSDDTHQSFDASTDVNIMWMFELSGLPFDLCETACVSMHAFSCVSKRQSHFLSMCLV